MLFHITTHGEWETYREAGQVCPESVATEGFVHASTGAQLVATANRLFRGKEGLLALAIDPARLPGTVRFEDLAGEGEAFPHIYDGLPLSAVVATAELSEGAEGYRWPAAWAEI